MEKDDEIHSPVVNREIVESREREYLHKHVTREKGREAEYNETSWFPNTGKKEKQGIQPRRRKKR